MKGKGIWFLGSLITLEPARRREPLGGAAGERQNPVTANKKFKRQVRAQAARAGETY